MANKEKIDYLLLDLKELETLIAGMRDAEVYPVSFFSQTFNLTHKVLNDLHSLETAQIEMLREQMEAHQALIQSLPNPAAAPMPIVPEVQEVQEVQEEPVAETVIVREPEVKVEVKEPVREIIIEKPEIITPPAKPEKPAETPHKPITTEKQGVFLSDLLEKKNLSDFRKAFSLNDRFRFRRELFGGDEEKMNKAITDLNDIHSYEESVAYLNNELKWNIEDEAVADFIKLLEKRFL
ncbi:MULTISPECIES: hypothetical protein [Parabacteroides]|jgi:hypothetical protein|uniref:hypothetical protein n=1 Tax=Parabacteroides TaxID=375288 RepID=UPI0006172053|nr:MULTISPECIES: hypothetical protein [Parabacteroides]KKB47770.1 hypothetical protein HMPREF1212_03618 [Parabacteroides sp. HGS0025]